MGIISDAQGGLTPLSVVEEGLNSNSSEILCKNEEEPIKMKVLECYQDFPHYNPMGAIYCHGNQSSDPL